MSEKIKSERVGVELTEAQKDAIQARIMAATLDIEKTIRALPFSEDAVVAIGLAFARLIASGPEALRSPAVLSETLGMFTSNTLGMIFSLPHADDVPPPMPWPDKWKVL